MDQLNHPQPVRPQGRPSSMVRDTDGPTVWSDGPQNKYDPTVYKHEICVLYETVQYVECTLFAITPLTAKKKWNIPEITLSLAI